MRAWARITAVISSGRCEEEERKEGEMTLTSGSSVSVAEGGGSAGDRVGEAGVADMRADR